MQRRGSAPLHGSVRLGVRSGSAKVPFSVATMVLQPKHVPELAPAASILPVRWSGPNNRRDFVTVVVPSAADAAYTDYFYTDTTAPDGGEIHLPAEAGTYELRYVSAQSNQVLARRKIVTTPISATLDAPATGKAGTKSVGKPPACSSQAMPSTSSGISPLARKTPTAASMATR